MTGGPHPIAPAALFIGPSVPTNLVRDLFPGEILPPIRRGDLDELLARKAPPELVGIVDGQFLQALAVSPKEVLRALDRSVRVYGSSSIGALRAVECGPFGMTGVGEIYRMYADGELDADDEVAIFVDPETQRPLSEPMVNIRVALRVAVAQGLITAATGELATALAKALYFPERSYQDLLHVLQGSVDDAQHAALTDFLTSGRAPDQKRADALALMHDMSLALGDTTTQPGNQPSRDIR